MLMFSMMLLFCWMSAISPEVNVANQTDIKMDFFMHRYYDTFQLSEKSDVYSFGVVLLELITGRPPIISISENCNLVHWVHQRLARGNIEDVIDARMKGEYDVNSVWRTADVASNCTERASIQRPTMADVVMQLKEGSALEASRERSVNSNPYLHTESSHSK